MSKILNNIIFKRILVIFVVGLVSRSIVNIAFDVNVFKDFMGVISLGYYGLMACFSAYVSELTQINFSSLNLSVFRSAAKVVSENNLTTNKIAVGDFTVETKKVGNSLKHSLILNQDSSGGRDANKYRFIFFILYSCNVLSYSC